MSNAATKSTLAERARCLWILDTILSDLRRQVNNKLLIESQIHLVKVKVQIAEALVKKAKGLIIANVQPKRDEESVNGNSTQ